jgi:uncharacterized membrane protein
MAYCPKCGAEVTGGAAFCAKCGAAQPSTTSTAPVTPAGDPAPAGGIETGMQENIAGLLSYVFGWVTGIIFFLIDKRPFVRFHAAQSIVVFGGLHILTILLGHFFGMGMMFGGFGWSTFGAGVLVFELVQLVTFILWILLMVKAAQHEKFRVPIAADFADKLASK